MNSEQRAGAVEKQTGRLESFSDGVEPRSLRLIPQRIIGVGSIHDFAQQNQSRIRERTQAVGSANHSRLRGHREHGI